MRTFLMSMEDGSEHIVQADKPSDATDYIGERLGMAVLGRSEIKDCKKPRIWGTVKDAEQDEAPAPEPTGEAGRDAALEAVEMSWSDLFDVTCSKLAELLK